MNCLNCGNKMNSNDKCCYKCGAINPNITENEDFMKRNKIKAQDLEKKDPRVKRVLYLVFSVVFGIVFISVILFYLWYFFVK